MERRIVVFAPSGQDAALTEKLFRSVQLDVCVCRSDFDLLERLTEGAGALLLTEEVLAPPTVALLRRFVEQQPTWSDLPVLLLTQHGAESRNAQRAFELLGNVTLLERPVRTMALVSAAKSALRARDRQYQVRSLNQRKDEFLATLAHELRNPLSPILNATSIFERLHPSPQTSKLVEMVNRQIRHLTRLIDDLMHVARITSGKLELQLAPTTVEAVATQALEISSGIMRDRRHRLSVHRAADEHVLHGDHVRLVQSLANVLVNAAKFTPVQGDISLHIAVQGATATFRVRDNGKGLTADMRKSIFEMFAQGRSVGEPSNGLGIGLHLAKVFVEMHAGTISAHSDGPGTGSEFVIQLPIVVPRPAGSHDAAGTGADAEPLPRSVLVVDDNEDAANTLEELLSLQGIAVSVAYNGAAAVDFVRREHPDAVVMDIGMPVMNGYEAARRIREEAGERTPMLIALTGWGQFSDRERARQAGFDHHFVKPLDLPGFLRCLSTATGHAAERSAGI